MFNFSSDDIYKAFEAAPNVNAALKNFLKREVQKGDPVERFVKDLKKAFSNNNPTAIKVFIDKSLPDYNQHFLLLAGYANAEVVNEISESVISAHAEAFNETYDTDDSGITVTDRATFDTIIGDVVRIIDNGLKEHKMPESQFMKLVLVNSIFEDSVMKEVLPHFQS